MATWKITYSVESRAHNGTLTIENDGMTNSIAKRYVADHVLRTRGVAPDALDLTDITVSYESAIE